MIFTESQASTETSPIEPQAVTDAQLLSIFQPLFERISQGAIAREQRRELPYDAVGWLREAGFGRLRVPQRYGGFGASLSQLFELLSQLAAADSNLPQIFRAHFGFVESRLNDQDAPNNAQWYQRIVAGDLFGAAMAERTDSTGNSVELSRAGQGWLLSGEKYYCTGTLYADWIAVSAVDGAEQVAIAVPTQAQGVTLVDDWDGFGQRLTASGTTKFEQVAVQDEQIYRRFKVGEVRTDTYITAFYQQIHLATLAGIARAILRDGIAFVQGRTRAFGIPGQSSPKDDPLVQRVIGRLSSLQFASQAMVEKVARSFDELHQAYLLSSATAEQYAAADIQTFQAQQVVIQLVLEASTLLFEVGGASAASTARGLDRHWRNARTLASHNPAILREAYLGDFFLNGTVPSAAWAQRFAQAQGSQTDAAQASAPGLNEGDLA
ncbi:acyl-CoA dehydrogenase family protein [Pseudomonas sp. 5P_3.1_Bac2]|uniref:acyl-CoA dehydrogenase family protein n=1 Tax=Pseudomonas sp. 5P_3.1_Bac2 TaxID=2971617 RepID=UPI0021C905F3|nr:acyl-CoA dehydrogenase family protein [Pseudomonas sp. 5P_3.1_Bac2]MCU1717232.1 acyl-CoA dehydrogenase family protein [Pseudomonas sp. 5P_3.1_Bac2]